MLKQLKLEKIASMKHLCWLLIFVLASFNSCYEVKVYIRSVKIVLHRQHSLSENCWG